MGTSGEEPKKRRKKGGGRSLSSLLGKTERRRRNAGIGGKTREVERVENMAEVEREAGVKGSCGRKDHPLKEHLCIRLHPGVFPP